MFTNDPTAFYLFSFSNQLLCTTLCPLPGHLAVCLLLSLFVSLLFLHRGTDINKKGRWKRMRDGPTRKVKGAGEKEKRVPCMLTFFCACFFVC